MRFSRTLHKYDANNRVPPLVFKDPFELCLKARWTQGRLLIGVEGGVTMAVSTPEVLVIRWHKDPGVDTWDDEEYERTFSWRKMAEEHIAGTVNRRLMFATLFTSDWYPQKGDKWLNDLDVIAREVG
jgi:hypothetical protein